MTKVTIYALYDEAEANKIRYVGKTVCDPETRFKQHLSCARRGVKRAVYHWMRKVLGTGGSVRWKILELTDEDNWEEKETYWIKFFRNFDSSAILNHNDGGKSNLNWIPTEETRKKMSASHQNWEGHWKGKKLSEEHKINIGDSGRGKKRTAETCKNISESLKGKPLSEEHKRSISKTNLGRVGANKKPVDKIDAETGALIETYTHLGAAAKANNIKHITSIADVCNGKYKKSGGFIWRFHKE